MYILNHLKSRIKRIEWALEETSRSLYPGNEDGFLNALVGEDMNKYRKGEGYDFIAALSATAAEDWAEDWAEGNE